MNSKTSLILETIKRANCFCVLDFNYNETNDRSQPKFNQLIDRENKHYINLSKL